MIWIVIFLVERHFSFGEMVSVSVCDNVVSENGFWSVYEQEILT